MLTTAADGREAGAPQQSHNQRKQRTSWPCCDGCWLRLSPLLSSSQPSIGGTRPTHLAPHGPAKPQKDSINAILYTGDATHCSRSASLAQTRCSWRYGVQGCKIISMWLNVAGAACISRGFCQTVCVALTGWLSEPCVVGSTLCLPLVLATAAPLRLTKTATLDPAARSLTGSQQHTGCQQHICNTHL